MLGSCRMEGETRLALRCLHACTVPCSKLNSPALLRGRLEFYAFRLGCWWLHLEGGGNRAHQSCAQGCDSPCNSIACLLYNLRGFSLTVPCVSAGQEVMHQLMQDCPIGNRSEGKPGDLERQVTPSEVDIPVVTCHEYRFTQAMYNFYIGRTVPALQMKAPREAPKLHSFFRLKAAAKPIV